ncbi:START-like domain containing protein [Parasponia andersonii]|uniref:START-like domain containing protein n=1 Tax=Parasponia andersonii TaxID=3476 RepID=A0A2P5AP45_PARAD|nr:START-like domain containing protein [Parasponia andersonii]
MAANKLDVHIDTTIPADQFYGFFKNNIPRFVQLFPRNMKNIQIQGGGGIRNGCVTLWKYDLGITGSFGYSGLAETFSFADLLNV